MLKIEKKLLEWADRHIYILALLLISFLALYIRRIPIWWNPENITAYFDCHENCTQSFSYYLLVLAVQYLPFLPVHSIKWISVIGDFGTAALCLLFVWDRKKDNALLPTICYTACLFSPVLILRGCVWAQIDSLAVMLFLLGWRLWEKEQKAFASICVLLSTLLLPCMLFFVFLILYIATQKKEEAPDKQDAKRRTHNMKEKPIFLKGLGFLTIWLICCGLAGLPLQKGFIKGIANGLAWLSYHPASGQVLATGLDWIMEILVYLGLPGSVIGGLMLVRYRKFPLFPILVLHFLITVLYGSRLFVG